MDGNGESEIIMCFWFVAFKDKPTISYLMNKFKVRNASLSKIKVVLADKDMTERDALVDKLLQSLFCYAFLTLRSFRSEISTEKNGISIGERYMCLKLLHILAYSGSRQEYDLQTV